MRCLRTEGPHADIVLKRAAHHSVGTANGRAVYVSGMTSFARNGRGVSMDVCSISRDVLVYAENSRLRDGRFVVVVAGQTTQSFLRLHLITLPQNETDNDRFPS